MDELCGQKGIKREYSVAQTPQQNGVAERKNRNVIEAARTMLADSLLPTVFWAEAVNTACYVLNRVLVTKPHNKTPYELIYNNPQFSSISAEINKVKDTCVWSLGTDETFSVKDARCIIDSKILPSLATSIVLDKNIPRKSIIFIWRLILDRLPHKLNLSSRGIDIEAISCPSCNGNVEFSNHVFFDCNIAKDIWMLVLKLCKFLFLLLLHMRIGKVGLLRGRWLKRSLGAYQLFFLLLFGGFRGWRLFLSSRVPEACLGWHQKCSGVKTGGSASSLVTNHQVDVRYYSITTRMAKQHHNEVNEIRDERLARTANPLALVAQQQPVYHHQNHPTQNTQYSSTRSQQPTRNRGKAIVTSSAPTYDPEPTTVTKDEEMLKEKEIDKLMALISLLYKKIYKPTNNNLRTLSNTSRANQDNSPRINRGTGYDNQRAVNVAGARENVGTSVVQKSGIQCYNCKEYGHVSRECQKPKRVKDAAYHKEKMLLCKQEETGVQLNAEQADWKDDTDDESEDRIGSTLYVHGTDSRSYSRSS
ncbi:reverse transcriptase domain-containing protein [Tanacetum coccineum]